MTLKEAAEILDVNYSTAKTIVQTYRKENRISKKPKHAVRTKKSLKRELFIARVLTQKNLTRLMTRIIAAESKVSKTRKSIKGSLQGNSEAQTLAATGQTMENIAFKSFPRVESAGQIQLFELEKEGPKPGQVSRAISADIQQHIKKNIFHVHSDVQPFKQEEKNLEVKGEKIEKSVVVEEMSRREGVFDFRRYGEMIMESVYKRYGKYRLIEG
jgi:hypothetical protein